MSLKGLGPTLRQKDFSPLTSCLMQSPNGRRRSVPCHLYNRMGIPMIDKYEQNLGSISLTFIYDASQRRHRTQRMHCGHDAFHCHKALCSCDIFLENEILMNEDTHQIHNVNTCIINLYIYYMHASHYHIIMDAMTFGVYLSQVTQSGFEVVFDSSKF